MEYSQRNMWDWEKLNPVWVSERRDEFTRLKMRADELMLPVAPQRWLELLHHIFEVLQDFMERMRRLLPDPKVEWNDELDNSPNV